VPARARRALVAAVEEVLQEVDMLLAPAAWTRPAASTMRAVGRPIAQARTPSTDRPTGADHDVGLSREAGLRSAATGRGRIRRGADLPTASAMNARAPWKDRRPPCERGRTSRGHAAPPHGRTGRTRRALRSAAVPLLLLAAAFALRALSFPPAVIDTDEGLYMLQAREWLRGNWPLSMVWDMHPVGAPAIFTAAMALLGEAIWVPRLLGVIGTWLTACGLYAIVRFATAPPALGLAAGLLYLAHSTLLGGLATNTEILFHADATWAMALALRGRAAGAGGWAAAAALQDRGDGTAGGFRPGGEARRGVRGLSRLAAVVGRSCRGLVRWRGCWPMRRAMRCSAPRRPCCSACLRAARGSTFHRRHLPRPAAYAVAVEPARCRRYTLIAA